MFAQPPAASSTHAHRPGDQAVVEWGERWWAAVVVADLGGDAWKVHYVGRDDSFDEVLPRSRIQMPSSR